ncbi:unnamed protein product [Rhizoctonia solani]|uniref:MIF4G domain-containing protein n=1 Tax=Rhizoctonia solani TaxID=456999 RepID=A0A8H3CZK5_9AGAM|nr:unnamed protein product [Rhizoctonia solani]
MRIRWVRDAEKRKEVEELFEAELKLRPKNIKNVEDLKTTSYPPSVNPPDLEFNFLVEPGRFRYHRSFLLQFMNVCTERPVSLVSLETLGLDPREASSGYPTSSRRRGRPISLGRGGALSAQHQASTELGLGPGLANTRGFAMGVFQSSSTSQSRFEASNASRARGTGFAGGRYYARGGFRRDDNGRGDVNDPGSWTVGVGGTARPSIRAGDLSQFGKIAKPPGIQFGPSSVFGRRDGYRRDNFDRRGGANRFSASADLDLVALLDALEAGNFGTASEGIIESANRSEQEEDGRTLKQIIELICKRAVDNPPASEMYARLCRKMMERISPNVQDETIRNSEGQPIAGGMLFRKYLINRCQEDFERGWNTKEAALAAATLKSEEDNPTEAASEGTGEAILYSDEHHAAAKANLKRQGVGLIQFFGELFKLQMLTERTMHECIKKLLSNVVNPEEEEIESLCMLLTSVGQSLDNPKARNHMDIYFERMQEMAKGGNISSQMQSRLIDVIGLRARHWQTGSTVPRPPTHQHPRNDAGRHNVTRGGIRRGEHRDANATEPDGWSIASAAGATRPPIRAGDLSQFGKIMKPTGIQFGPSSVFSKKGANKQDLSIGRASGGNMNMFQALLANAADGPPPPVDLGPGGSPTTAGTGERKKLKLLPRTKPTETEVDKAGGEGEDNEVASAPMTEEEAQTKVKEDVKVSLCG